MFKCDTARIASPCRTLFLIIGYNRNTKQDSVQWLRYDQRSESYKPYDFDYVSEKVIARGRTKTELIASAKEYKKLLVKFPDPSIV
jgi:hypothetical protein